MKQRTKFVVAILCIALLLSMVACGKTNDAPTISAEESALQRYRQAVEALAQAPDLTVEAEYACDRIVGGETYTEKMTETSTYRGLGTDSAAASVKQQVAFGPYETQYSRFYRKGIAYCKTEDSTFKTEMKIQEFIGYQTPAILIDAALYNAVKVDKILDSSVITFAEPTALESWATDVSGAKLVSASGTVTLDEGGNIVKSTYVAEFTCGKTTYSLQVSASVKLEAAQTLDDDLSALPKKCPAISYFDAPRKILQVVGDVYTAKAMTAKYTESVYSAAFARSRSQTSTFDIYGVGETFMAKSSYEVVNTDYSNTPVTNSEVVTYRDSICTSVLNGGDPTVREGITEDTMRRFCEDAVLAALFTPNHLKDATVSEKKGQLRIKFTGNTDFADYVCSNIYAIFNANLDTYAESSTPPAAGGYLYINRETGLPVALGINLERQHVSGDVAYALTYELEQTMQLSSTKAYKNITGEKEPTPTQP